jgi:hypothetical protein
VLLLRDGPGLSLLLLHMLAFLEGPGVAVLLQKLGARDGPGVAVLLQKLDGLEGPPPEVIFVGDEMVLCRG